MSSKATTGVVDPRGRVWGTESLYVADASIFPTASAVNPMITVSLYCPHRAVRSANPPLATTEHVPLALDFAVHRPGPSREVEAAYRGQALSAFLSPFLHFIASVLSVRFRRV